MVRINRQSDSVKRHQDYMPAYSTKDVGQSVKLSLFSWLGALPRAGTSNWVGGATVATLR